MNRCFRIPKPALSQLPQAVAGFTYRGYNSATQVCFFCCYMGFGKLILANDQLLRFTPKSSSLASENILRSGNSGAVV